MQSFDDSLHAMRGSVPWMAPEMIKQSGHGRSADVWSVGATMIEMCTARYPWPPFTNNMAAMYHVATATEVRCEICCTVRLQHDIFVILGVRGIGILGNMPRLCLM